MTTGTLSPPVRNSMRQTATIKRSGPTTSTNPIGGPVPGAETTWSLPCRAWEATESAIGQDGKRYSVSILKLRVPLAGDVLANDTLTVEDMTGTVRNVLTRRGHKLVTVEDYHA